MARNPIRSRIIPAACALAIALLAAPAWADDAARISFLESEIQKLRIDIDEQDRRIQRLEAAIARLGGAAAPARVTIGRPDTAAPAPAAAPLPWHSMAAWDAITQGMTREQVMEILGKPIAVEAVDAYETLFYRGATVKGTAISGHVNLRDGRVVAVSKPVTGE
jgi:hypothetical protein